MTRQRDQVYDLIHSCSPRGIIAERVAIRLKIRTASATARIRELVQIGWVRNSGSMAVTSAGRRAILWQSGSEADRAKRPAKPAVKA